MPAHTIRFCTLASGSSGNAMYCESADGAVLIDAGITCKRIRLGLEATGFSAERIDGILLTHAHGDHIRGAGAACRGLQKPCSIPIFMSPGTLNRLPKSIGKIPARPFRPGTCLSMGGFRIQTLPTPHDAPESVAVVLERGETRIGIFTDLGHPFDALKEILPTLDAVLLESNYDPDLLRRNGNYPQRLKARISGKDGHISNREAAELIRLHASPRLRIILLGHLSENNNTPELALQTHRKWAAPFLDAHRPILNVAPRHTPSRVYILTAYRESAACSPPRTEEPTLSSKPL